MAPIRKRKLRFASFGAFSGKSGHSASRRLSIPRSPLVSLAKRSFKEEKLLNQDLSRANQIQLSLLPTQIPSLPGFDIRVHYVSCKEIGGDYYDFIEIDKDHLGMVVADVSGKGISGAMIMAMARSVIRLLAEKNPDAKDTIIRANRIIAKDVKNVMFLTAIYLVLNIRTRTLEVVNAGHNPLIYWNGETSKLVNPAGIAIGFDYGPIFEASLRSEQLKLEPGHRVVAFTDGVVECRNKLGKEYGQDRLVKKVEEYGSLTSGECVNNLVNDLADFQGSAPQLDDITILTFNYRTPEMIVE